MKNYRKIKLQAKTEVKNKLLINYYYFCLFVEDIYSSCSSIDYQDSVLLSLSIISIKPFFLFFCS